MTELGNQMSQCRIPGSTTIIGHTKCPSVKSRKGVYDRAWQSNVPVSNPREQTIIGHTKCPSVGSRRGVYDRARQSNVLAITNAPVSNLVEEFMIELGKGKTSEHGLTNTQARIGSAKSKGIRQCNSSLCNCQFLSFQRNIVQIKFFLPVHVVQVQRRWGHTLMAVGTWCSKYGSRTKTKLV